ncbi:MAG TPA: hypothetical protein VH251_04910 [Verrucomicrobiae bacterium]|jgi:hypothetical protein|nr:hypothetical protein [Verrucomicrobiae bacterium]
MTDEESDAILKAQAELVIHLTERMVLLQVAFEAFVHGQIGEEGPESDTHYKHREELMALDFSGKTTELLNTLRKALTEADR